VRPYIADLGHDNRPDLITVDDSGMIEIFPDVLLNPGATFVGQSTILKNNVLNANQRTEFGPNLKITAADLDNDQKPEIILGTNGGGLLYLKNTSQLLGTSKDLETLKLAVFPNPANEMLEVTSQEKVRVTVFDMAGRELMQSGNGFTKEHQLNVSTLKPGVYFLKISTPDFRSAGRSFIVQH